LEKIVYAELLVSPFQAKAEFCVAINGNKKMKIGAIKAMLIL
jgi:hypothetical protein